MSSRSQLDAYILQLEARLRLGALLRGGAILTSAALAVTVVLVLITNHFAFSSGSLTGARIILLIAVAFAVGFGLALPLYGLDRRRAAGSAENAFPEFQQRLVTFTERDLEGRDPFIELLAADTLSIAERSEPKQLFSDAKLVGSLATGVFSLGILVWMIMSGPGYLGHGASLLWLGTAHSGAPLYDLQVTPGDVTVRRNSDQVVTAQLTGITNDQVRLYARYQSTSKWDQIVMQPQPGSTGYQFLFVGIPEGVEYYVEAGALRSRHFNIKVADLPAIKQIRVTYHYPSWTGQPPATEERSGDLSAVEGTQAELAITTDRPLKGGILVMDNNQQLQLTGGEGNVYKGTVQIDKDGLYHVAELEDGQGVRLSEDYFIEASKANPPDVRILRPGKDYRANPIEEVTVAVNAAGDFGLQDMTLHYSVNGGTEYTVPLLKVKGAKEADGTTVIPLESFKLVPGDLLSLYATAKDAHSESRSDITFVQADPFERDFSQSQQSGGGGGGGGGGGNQAADISAREKEIISATFKQQGLKNVPPATANEQAKFLADVQSKLHDQALSLAGRLEARELTDENQTFNVFQQDMNAAAMAMEPASEKLAGKNWKDAIPNEQKALQFLLRAEATFRQIQVAFGARGGGAGGSGDTSGRDLASLFDLELDTEKNQYEVGQTANSEQKREQDIDDALKKLDELEKRQQDLANQQQNKQDFQERYQQEMLRREAEELQRQMEQLARNGPQGGQQDSSASGGQPQPGQQSQAGGSGGADSRLKQAADQLKQANDDMRRAASQSASEADARRAADRLREAQNLLGGMQNQQSSQKLDSMAREGDQIAQQQKQQEDQLKQAFNGQQGGQQGGGQGANGKGPSRDQLNSMAGDRQQLGQDVARLEKEMQDAARELASGNRDAATKLRDGVSGAQQSDLANRIQRSTDWIRRGIDPNSNSGEAAIGADINKLVDQLHQAQQAMGGNGQQNNGQQQALNQVDQLRQQMDALSRGLNNRANGGQNGQRGQGGGAPNKGGSGAGPTAGQGGPGGSGTTAAGARQGAGRQPGTVGGFDPGGFEPETGKEVQEVPRTQAEMDAAYQAAMQELEALRNSVKDQPEQLGDISELKKELQQLDPKRFPGNPQMLQEINTKLSATVDKLELQLRRDDSGQPGQIRSGDSQPVPTGYADSVAEYFRRLSNKNPNP